MAINFVQNDLRATDFNAPISRTQHQNRPASLAGFTLSAGPPAAKYPVPSADFVYWQARESALVAVDAFESIYGSTVKKWARAPSPKKLTIAPDAGVDVNAYYDGSSLSFFHAPIGTKTVYSGASTDVVAHEAGHALLDVLRPDLWDVPYLEVGAFHEAFGDCIAVLTALADKSMRKKLVGTGSPLTKKNFIETTAEELSWAIGQLEPNHNASKPRKALNKYKWVLPSTLPMDGAGGVLINEVHSFAQVFTGCFYDLLVLVFQNGAQHSETGLWSAAKIVGRLLFAGAEAAPARQRFFRTVGQGMLQADATLYAGKYGGLITQAFKNHDIDLAAGFAFAPRSSLAGRVTQTRGGRMSISRTTMRDLRSRLRADPKSHLEQRAISFGNGPMMEVRHYRAVDLTGVARYLKGVRCYVAEPVVVGRGAGAAATIMSSLPDSNAAEEEALIFVAGLAWHGQIERADKPAKARAARRKNGSSATVPTHRVAMRAGEKVLERKRFACDCLAGS